MTPSKQLAIISTYLRKNKIPIENYLIDVEKLYACLPTAYKMKKSSKSFVAAWYRNRENIENELKMAFGIDVDKLRENVGFTAAPKRMTHILSIPRFFVQQGQELALQLAELVEIKPRVQPGPSSPEQPHPSRETCIPLPLASDEQVISTIRQGKLVQCMALFEGQSIRDSGSAQKFQRTLAHLLVHLGVDAGTSSSLSLIDAAQWFDDGDLRLFREDLDRFIQNRQLERFLEPYITALNVSLKTPQYAQQHTKIALIMCAGLSPELGIRLTREILIKIYYDDITRLRLAVNAFVEETATSFVSRTPNSAVWLS